MTTAAVTADVEARARLSLGRGHLAIHAMVAQVLASRDAGGTLADVGCGTGDLWRAANVRFSHCVGLDAVRYEGLPATSSSSRSISTQARFRSLINRLTWRQPWK